MSKILGIIVVLMIGVTPVAAANKPVKLSAKVRMTSHQVSCGELWRRGYWPLPKGCPSMTDVGF
jgi:hypothetical protein